MLCSNFTNRLFVNKCFLNQEKAINSTAHGLTSRNCACAKRLINGQNKNCQFSGNGEDLEKLGLTVIKHLPGVGQNLQDHLELYVQHRSKEVNENVQNNFGGNVSK